MAYGVKRMKRKLKQVEAGGTGMNPGTDPERIKKRIRFLEKKENMANRPQPQVPQGGSSMPMNAEAAATEAAQDVFNNPNVEGSGQPNAFPQGLMEAIQSMYNPPQRPISGGIHGNWNKAPQSDQMPTNLLPIHRPMPRPGTWGPGNTSTLPNGQQISTADLVYRPAQSHPDRDYWR